MGWARTAYVIELLRCALAVIVPDLAVVSGGGCGLRMLAGTTR